MEWLRDNLRLPTPGRRSSNAASTKGSKGHSGSPAGSGGGSAGISAGDEERLDQFSHAWAGVKTTLTNPNLNDIPASSTYLSSYLNTLLNLLIVESHSAPDSIFSSSQRPNTSSASASTSSGGALLKPHNEDFNTDDDDHDYDDDDSPSARGTPRTKSRRTPRTPSPSAHPLILGPCLEYTFRHSIPSTLVDLALPDHPIGSKSLAVHFFSRAVTEIDDERFLIHDKVHRPLLRLIRACVTPDRTGEEKGGEGGWMTANPEYEVELVELMCGVCGRIRATPELLVLFMTEKKPSTTGSEKVNGDGKLSRKGSPTSSSSTQSSSTASRTVGGGTSTAPTSIRPSAKPGGGKSTPSNNIPSYEFLLFSYLLRFLHREGRAGDFARAGMLFLVELALSGGNVSLIKNPDGTFRKKKMSDLFGRRSGGNNTPQNGRGRLGGGGGGGRGDDDGGKASKDAAFTLASYLLESDFAEVLGAGLGALYGLLPGKLVVRTTQTVDGSGAAGEDEAGHVDFDGGMVLGGLGGEEGEEGRKKAEEEEVRMRAMGVERSSNPEVKRALDLWLRLIEFTQDVLRKAPEPFPVSDDDDDEVGDEDEDEDPFLVKPQVDQARVLGNAITHSILSSIRTLFLSNVLYPSILECSETDGSAVAVLSYLDSMLSVLEDNSKLCHLILNYLAGDDEGEKREGARRLEPRKRTETMDLSTAGTPPRSEFGSPPNKDTSKHGRRKSSALLLVEATAPTVHGPSGTYFDALGRFSLRDLILAHIHSRNQPTATAALKLFNTLLGYHDSYALDLLDVLPDDTATAFPFAPVRVEDPDPLLDERKSDASSEIFVYPGDEEESKEAQEELSDDEDSDPEEFHYPAPRSATQTPTQTPKAGMAFPSAEVWGQGRDAQRTPSPSRPAPSSRSPPPTVLRHKAEVNELLSLVELIDVDHTTAIQISSTSFSNYLKDAEDAVAAEPAFRRGLNTIHKPLAPEITSPKVKKRQSMLLLQRRRSSGAGMTFKPRGSASSPSDIMVRHRLDVYSPLISLIFESLARFFSHSPDLNLALTGVIASLALCPYRSLDGWLLPAGGDSDHTALGDLLAQSESHRSIHHDDGDDRSVDFQIAELSRQEALVSSVGTRNIPDQKPAGLDTTLSWDESWIKRGAIFSMLRELTFQVEHYRQTIPKFDQYLDERRQGLMFVDSLADALDSADHLLPPLGLPPPPKASTSTTSSTASKISSAFGFLTPEPPKRSKGSSAAKVQPSPSSGANGAPPVSPFSSHYRQTGSITIKPLVAATPKSTRSGTGGGSSGILSPVSSSSPTVSDDGRAFDTPTKATLAGKFVTNRVGGSSVSGSVQDGVSSTSTSSSSVSLSAILDNVVVLEEAIKELVAIIQVRKSFGIDEVRFI